MKFLDGKTNNGSKETEEKSSGERSLDNLHNVAGDVPVVMDDIPEITIEDYLKAGYSLLYIRTEEDHRAISIVKKAIEGIDNMYGQVTFAEWKSTTGLLVAASGQLEIPENAASKADDPAAALKYIQTKANEPHVLCMHNVRTFLQIAPVVQQLKDTAFAARLVGSHVILIGASIDIPPELQNLMTVYDLDLPSQDMFVSEFKVLANAYKSSLKEKATSRVLQVCAASAVGMTLLQGENAIALSIAKHQKLDPTIIQLEKEQAIKRSDVLEFVHDSRGVSHLGGFTAYKTWIAKRKDSFGPEAEEYGLKFPKGVLVVGIPGCLAHDSLLTIRRGDRRGGRKYTIQDAFYKFNNIPRGPKEGGFRSGSRYFWDRSIPTYLLAHIEDKGRVGFHEIDDIVHSGFKITYAVTTESGKALRTTDEHRFSVPESTPGSDAEGCKRLDALEVGDYILVRGTKIKTNKHKIRPSRPIRSVKYHPYARRKAIAGRVYLSVGVHRLSAEAEINGYILEDFIALLQSDQSGTDLLFLDPQEYEVHHIDEDPENNDPSNLMILTTQEHLEVHEIAGNPLNFGNQRVVAERIVSIELFGREEVFDIVMKDPYRTFISNDFLVHNTGKSLAAKVTANYFGVPLLKLDMGRVFKSLVGSSEASVRSALKTAEAVAPVVLWIEEIEKSMAGSQSSGSTDSGTTARVMSTILTWMQENNKPIFLACTANNVESLPPELLRKGRFSEIWGAVEPDEAERVEIWNIHLGIVRKERLLAGDFDVAALAQVSNGYTGAEIEGVVEEAMFDAWSDKHREMTMDDLLGALRSVVPQSVMCSERIDIIRDWMKSKARYVSGFNPHCATDTKVDRTFRKIREHTTSAPSDGSD